MTRFAQTTALVTGASRGLGRAIAVALAGEGAFVWAGYRAAADEAAKTVELLRAAGGDGAPLAFDVREPTQVDRAVASALEARGRLEVVVNCAGVARDELFAVMSQQSWREVLAANLDGTFNVCRAVARPMLAKRRGAIVNVASVAGLRASPGQVNYAASKGGVLALTASLAAELAPRGVRVNAVVPGLFAAGLVERLDRRLVEQRRAQVPLGRLGAAEELAAAVLFLASDDASFVVGQALVVDGGLCL